MTVMGNYRLRAASLLGLVVVLCLMTVPAAADDSQPDRRLIQELIDQLSSPSRATRLDAEQQLRSLGPSILPELPEADEIESAQAREVVENLRHELELVAAEESLAATMVQVTDVKTLGEWVGAIASQTGYNVVLADDELGSINLPVTQESQDHEPVEFWQAVSDLEDQIPIDVTRSPAGDIVLIERPADAITRRHDICGAIRVSASEFREIENLIDPEQNIRLRTQIRLDVEPKLAGLFLHWKPADLHASVAGLELTPSGAGGRRELPIPASQQVEFPVDFTVPRNQWSADADHTLFNVTGTLLVKVATGFQEFSFRHLDEPGQFVRQRAGVVVTLESFEANRPQEGSTLWEARLSVDYRSHPLVLDSYQLWVFSNAISLHRENGSVLLPAEDRQVSPAEGGAVRMSFRFEDELDDIATATLVYEAPTAIMDVPVEFEIEAVGSRQ